MAALDVGVQPVPDHERRTRPSTRDRVGHQRCGGLAGHHGLLARRVAQRGDHRTIPHEQAPFGRQGGVDVRRDPQRAGPDRERRLRQLRPTGVRRVSLDHRGRSVVGTTRHPDTDFADFLRESVGTDHQCTRTRLEMFGQQPRARLCTRDDEVVGRLEPQLTQVRGHLGRPPARVVGHEEPRDVQPGEGIERIRQRVVPGEHRAVEVEEQCVVTIDKGHGVGRRGSGGFGHGLGFRRLVRGGEGIGHPFHDGRLGDHVIAGISLFLGNGGHRHRIRGLRQVGRTRNRLDGVVLHGTGRSR